LIAAGVDVGSVATKAAVLRDGEVAGTALVETGAEPAAAAEAALDAATAEAGIERGAVEQLVTTGYGRRATRLGGRPVTEITACARGAHHVGCPWGAPRLVADLGGQDTKVILLDEDGEVRDFLMNDKCAAGTGRFLEVMSRALDVPLEEFAEVGSRSESPAAVHATCTVFAESEVVSLIAQGASKEEIIAGLHTAVARRIAQLAAPLGSYDVFFAGGGARDTGVAAALRRELGREVYVPPAPQHVVAVGAARVAAR